MKKLQQELYANNKKAGWWEQNENNAIAIKNAAIIANMHSVLSESLEKVRKGGDINLDDIVAGIEGCLLDEQSDGDGEHDLLLSKVALIHSEVSEVAEYISGKEKDKHLTNRSGLSVEIADSVMRLLDLAEHNDIDIEEVIREKLEYNKYRADHQHDTRSKKNGKKI